MKIELRIEHKNKVLYIRRNINSFILERAILPLDVISHNLNEISDHMVKKVEEEKIV